MFRKVIVTILVLGVLIAETGSLYAQAPPRTITFKTQIEGTVNGESLGGSGTVVVDLETGGFTHEAELLPVPRNFVPVATGCFLAVVGSFYAGLPVGGASNLRALIGPRARYAEPVAPLLVKDEVGRVIGRMTGSYDIRVDGASGTAKVGLNGTYAGPTDLVFPGSYDMIISQRAEGEIFGKYTQTVFTARGTPIFIEGSALYRYTGKRLPFRQVIHVRFTTFKATKAQGTTPGRVRVTGLSWIEPLH